MKKMYRHMMLFSSTVVFLAVAPLVVLFAMGYRMGTSAVDPLPFGVVLVDSLPKHAQLMVNGENHGDTPKTVSGLMPGDAHISLTKDGYQPWEKTIHVEPGLLSEFRDVRLFPNQVQKTTIASNVTSFSLSPNRALLALLTNDKNLVVIDEEGKLINTPVQLTVVPKDILWSPDSTSLLVLYTKGPGQVILIASAEEHPPTIKTLTSIKQASWDPRVPGRLLLLTNTGDLKAFSHVNNSVYAIAQDIQSFATSTKQIYTLDATGAVSTYTLSGEKIDTVSFDLTSPIKKLLITPAGKQAVITADKALFLLPDSGDPVKVSEHVISAGWSPDGQLLYIQPEQNELYVYNAGTDRLPWLPLKELQLVVRLSRPISDPQWFAGGRHLIYQANDEIMISEIDTRDRALQSSIDTTNMGHAEVAVGTDGDRLFYLTKTNQATNLVVLPL